MDNQYVVVIGRVGIDPIAFVGPFATEDEANACQAQNPSSHIDILINPANLPEKE